MANDNTLNVEIKAIITDLQKNLKKATQGLEKFSEKSKVVGKKMTSIGKKMSIGFTAPLAILGGTALKAAADLETLETSLSVMTGSAENGKKLLKELTDFAAKTPFQLEGIGNTAKALLAFGFSTEEVKNNLKFLGDVAAGSGNRLGEVGRIFGQVAAAGKLTGERLLQFQERAIPIGPALAKTMGVAESSIQKLVSEGKVSFADFEKAFKSLSEEGGMFEGAMIKQSRTIAGVFSTLKDNVQLALGQLGTDIEETFDLKGVANKLIAKIQEITKWFKELDKSTKKTIIVIAGVVAAAGPLLTVLGLFTSTVIPGLVIAFGFLKGAIVTTTLAMTQFTLAFLANPIGAATVIIAGAAIAFAELLDSLTGLNDAWQTFMNALKSGGNYVKFAKLQSESLTNALYEQDQAYIENGRKTRENWIAKQNAALAEYNQKQATDKATAAIKAKTKALEAEIKAQQTSIAQKNATTDFSDIRKGGGMFGLGVLSGGGDSILSGFTQFAEDLKIPVADIKETIEEVSADISGALEGAAIGAAVGMSQIIGSLMSGETGLADIGGALLSLVGDLAVQLGQATIAVGIGMLGLKAAFSNPLAAIAAGAAMVAIGTAMSSISQGLDSVGGSGGSTDYSSGSSNSSFRGSSSSVSSGGNSGGTYVFEIQGTKLIGVLKNTLNRNKSLGGSNNLLFT